uniref:Receptor for retinol uptake STRA6 n=1 Tax=Macrostomum lignano TaxID=282301 RepID=A0A1I8I7K4_9PLAT
SDDPEVQQMWASGEPMNGLWDMIRIQLQLQRTKLNATDICTDKINIILVYEYALVPAVIMLIMACCSMRRKRFLPDFLSGRPGLAHPMNILEDRSFRFSYALAFGIAAQLCHDLLFGDSDLYKRYITSRPEGQFKFLHVLYRISEICLYCVIMYPIFITITKRNILFFGMGTIYMWGLTIMSILRLAWLDCAALTLESHIIIMIKFLPSIGCMLGLSAIFPYRMVQLILGKNASMRVTRLEYVYQVEYVRDLFINKTDSRDSAQSNSVREKLKQALRAISYQRRIGFRYSPRIICTYTAVGIVIYMVLYGIIKEVSYWIKLLTDILDLLEGIIRAIGIGGESNAAGFEPRQNLY